MNGKYSKAKRSPEGLFIKIKTEKNGLGALKAFSVAFVILLKLVVFVLLHIWFVQILNIYALISFVLSVLACIYALSSDRSPTAKAVLIFIAMALFIVGYYIVLFTDQRVFFARAKKRYKRVFERTAKTASEGKAEQVDGRVAQDCKYLKTAGGFEAFDRSDVKYFSSGGQLLDDILESVSKAEKFVFIEFFIISDGILLNALTSVLEEKVKNGVEVRIIYDDLGSFRTFSKKSKRRLKKCGVQLVAFNRFIPFIKIAQNIRDHRKIVVVDGKTAYTGGVNIADEYMNTRRMYGYWKDAGVRVEGAAVDGFTLMFLRQWDYLTGGQTDCGSYYGLYTPKENSSAVVPFACGLDYDTPIGKEVYLNIIAKAQKRLYLMTPYLVPDNTVMNMLVNKAKSGCDVRIVLPQVPDKAYVYTISLDNARILAREGVKVFLMKNSFVHSKVMLSDYCAVIGSVNLDMRSFFQQLESALYTDDECVMADVGKDFEKTFGESVVYTCGKQRLTRRVYTGVLRLLSPLM